MAALFDHMDVCLTTGIHTASVGKHALYTGDMDLMTNTPKFASNPFTALIRNMYLRFRSLDAYYVAQDSRETSKCFFRRLSRNWGAVQMLRNYPRRLSVARGGQKS